MLIKENAQYLRLTNLRNNFELYIKEALTQGMSLEEFLDTILRYEAEYRKSNLIEKRIKAAKFPYHITFDEFKTDHLSIELKQKIRELSTLEFIDNKENIILIGNPGTGKTALSVALGLSACTRGKRVLFISVPQLIIEVNEAMSKSQYLSYKNKFEKYDLVILDELGYSSFSRESGDILFNLLSSKNDSGSIIVTSNLTVDKWIETFKDQFLTGAMVDRLTRMAHMIDMSGESYRLRQTREWMNKTNEK